MTVHLFQKPSNAIREERIKSLKEKLKDLETRAGADSYCDKAVSEMRYTIVKKIGFIRSQQMRKMRA